MARSKPVVLESFSWPTQVAAEAAFQHILRSSGYGLYDCITNPEHDRMLRELLDRHQDKDDKLGEGVEHFFIGRTIDDPNIKFKVKRDAIGIWIKNTNGTKQDFSYLSAIRSNSAKSDAKECLRTAVDDQRFKYRDSRFAALTPVISDLSGLPIHKRDQAQVVYLEPTWGQLTFRFAEAEGGWDMLRVHAGHGSTQIGGRLVDPAIETRWLQFHGKYSKLGIATASEAASRPRVKDDAWTPSF